MWACEETNVTITSANALPSRTFSCLYGGRPSSPAGSSTDLTADAAALYKAIENDEQEGPKWTSRTRPSVIISTAIGRTRGFRRLNEMSRQTSTGVAIAHPFAVKAAAKPAVPARVSQIKGTAARRKSPTNADHAAGVASFVRQTPDCSRQALVLLNLGNASHAGYRIGLPRAGWWREVLNSDSEHYGGANLGNNGGVDSQETPWHSQPWSAEFNLPPLSCLVFLCD